MDRQLPLPPSWNNPAYGYPGHAAPLTQNPPAFQHPLPPGVSSDQYAYAGHPSNTYSWACYGGAAPPPPGLESWQRSSPTTNTPQPATDDAPELTNERKRPSYPADRIEDLHQQLEDTKMQLERSQKTNRDLVVWMRRELKRSYNRQDELEDFVSRLTGDDGTDGRSPATTTKSRCENTMGWAQQGLGKSRGQPGSNSLQGPFDHQQQKSRSKPNSHQRKAKRKAKLQDGDAASVKTEDAEESGEPAEAQSQDDGPRAPAQVIPPLVRPTHQTRF